jgi:hypothetical protein
MWSRLPVINEERAQERDFVPPYCPNPECKFHPLGMDHGVFFVRNGTRIVGRFPYISQRFYCKACLKAFCSSFFRLEYRDHKLVSYEKIFSDRRKGITLREIGRSLNVSECLIRLRIKKMTRQCLLKHARYIEGLSIHEPIVYDGLENFSYSQFDPNNINHAVGKESLFVYDFNLAPLNRKGRMSPKQKKRRIFLEKKFGVYPKNAIEATTRKILHRLYAKRAPGKTLELYSDNHYAYRNIVTADFKDISHTKISSKAYRNYSNHLFAVNHLDMLTRQNTAPFKRETISFSKHSIAMQECFLQYICFKNYMRPTFYQPHKKRPAIHRTSPAMALGLTKKILTFAEFFKTRLLRTHVRLNEDAISLFHRIDPTSRRPISPYLGL